MARETTDALEILRRRIGNEPDFNMIVAEEHEKSAVARAVYKLRTEMCLTQAELAKRVGTKQFVISRLEDGDYTSHPFKILRRIAEAVNYDIEVSFVPKSAGTNKRRSTSKGLTKSLG